MSRPNGSVRSQYDIGDVVYVDVLSLTHGILRRFIEYTSSGWGGGGLGRGEVRLPSPG